MTIVFLFMFVIDFFLFLFFFFFNDTATTEIYTLSLHDALPTWRYGLALVSGRGSTEHRSLGLVTRSGSSGRRSSLQRTWRWCGAILTSAAGSWTRWLSSASLATWRSAMT